MTEYWDIETQHTVGYAMMTIGAVLLPFILIWAISEWFGHPTLRDIGTFAPPALIISGALLIAWAIRLA
jgi:hypothetical protein